MGFFGITSRRSAVSFTIEACHLTVWVLSNPWYAGFGLKFFCDVGLRIVPNGGDLRQIRIACPFDSDGGLVDLSNVVLDPEFSPLIFGVPVKIDGDRVTYKGEAIGQVEISDRVIAVSVKDSREEETAAVGNFSTWTIELKEPARNNEPSYIRFRLPINDASRIWASKGWGFAKRGALVDLRIADVRESILLGNGRSEAMHIVPIKRLFAFLVAPAYFVPQHISPPLHYSRLLEPTVWKRYLKSCGTYEEATKLSIHQWRALDTPVSVDRPFRAYADLSREFGLQVFLYYILGAASAPLIFPITKWLWSLVETLF